jgi:glycosyltransferase involved in cell wall biosynthesis
MYWRLRAAIHAFQPHIVHTHRYVLRYALPFVVGQSSPKCVHTVHNIAEREVTRLGRHINRIAFRAGVKAVAIGDEVSASLTRVYGLRDPPLIRIGIPIADYDAKGKQGGAVRLRLGIAPSDVVFTCVGRFTEQKHQGLLLRAFAEAFGSTDGARLLFVGDGPDRQMIEALAKSLSVERRVSFLGVRRDIPAILADTDVFVLASRWEGTPLSVMEAMVAGKAVLATRVGSVPEMLSDGVSGLLIPPENLAALRDALRRLFSDQGLRERLGARAMTEAKGAFSAEAMAHRYEELYAAVVAVR